MNHYAILRLLLAGFFLYYVWPFIPQASSSLEQVFWGFWLVLLFLVIGGNLATVLQIRTDTSLEQEQVKVKRTLNR